MKDYFLSSHASVDAKHKIAVPDGCRVLFYVPEGKVLSNKAAFEIFENLANDETPGGIIDHFFEGGDLIPNYNIWELLEYPDYSGIFIVGNNVATIALNGYTEQNPLKLSDLFKLLEEPKDLYWVACA